MYRLLSLIGFLLALPTGRAEAQVVVDPPAHVCPVGVTCVDNGDMQVFIQLLQDQKCRTDTQPEVTADPVTIIVDRKGRVYGSGTGPKPYTLHLKWCNYEITAKSNLTLQVAQRVEPDWGFRLRLKATFGVLGVEAFKAHEVHEALDGGLMLEPFFYHWVNLSAYVGIRATGVGVGIDLTTNFGAFVGYAITWGSWRSNPFVSVYFAF